VSAATILLRGRALRLACWLAGLCLLGGLAGCAHRGERAGEAEPVPGVAPAPGGLKFAVRVAPLKFAPGDRVTLEASLFNDSEDSFKRKFASHCIWDYEITTPDGVPLRAARECIPEDTTMVLAPGELGMIVREWSGRQRYFNAAQPLAAGRYLIIAGFLDGGRVVPMSVPVEIEVMERHKAR
jgi:hypothetical protein